MTEPLTIDQHHSSQVTLRLTIDDQTLELAAVGPTRLVLREPRLVREGLGELTITVDQHIETCQIKLLTNAAPTREISYKKIT